jgi:hypothetical protein
MAPTTLRAEDVSGAKVDDAVERGLAFLAKEQNEDGSLSGGGPPAAVTGLAVMAFLACGQVPDTGRYGLTVRRAVDYLVRQVPVDGYVGKVDGSRMYGQGIVTLALAETLGVESNDANRRRTRAALLRAVQVILDAHAVKKDEPHDGGWRYEPTSSDSDLSLSGWNALALRAAADVGVDVPKDRAERGLAYVMRCYRADRQGFAYQPGGEATAAMTGVGLLGIFLLDRTDRPEITAAAGRFLLAHPIDPQQTRYPYYAFYYATQAAFQAGEPVWPAVWQQNSRRLVEQQTAGDGGWPASHSSEEPGRVYATSMAVLTLAVPYRLLPVYQR